MSACGRAQELLDDWRDGQSEEHRHGFFDECRRCTAETDTWEVIQELIVILTPTYVTPANGPESQMKTA